MASVIMYGLGAGLVAYAGTSLTHQTQLRIPLLAAVATVTLLAALLAAWQHHRARPVRDLAAALAPVLRPDDPQQMIKARRRRGGVPTRLTITYPATFDERDDKARSEVRDIIATRLGATVEATWRPTRRQIICRIDPTAGPGDIVDSDTTATTEATGDSAEQARLRTRTTDVVQAIMGASARVADIAFDGDSPTRVDVAYATTSRDLSEHFRQRVIMQLDSKLPGRWRDTWDLENDTVTFQLRPPFPTNVPYPLMHKLQRYEIPYSVSETGQILTWKLGSKNPHCLTVGPTGSGKTVFIRNLVVGARLLGIPVVLCDPKMTEYIDFEDWDGVRVITDTEEIAKAITLTHHEMMRRYDLIKRRQARKGEFGKVLFILDEFYIFKEAVQELWAAMRAKDKNLKGREHPCLSHWKRKVVLARTAEIHLVVGIQRPDAEFLTGLARDSFRHRISLDRATPEAARMMWGNSRIGTDLPSIQGRAVATTDHGAGYVQVLRLLTPSDVDDYTEDDARTWEALTHRLTTQAEAYANGGEDLAFLGTLGHTPPTGSPAPAAPAFALGSAEPTETAAPGGAPDSDPDEGDLEDVGVYELEPGDVISLEDGGLVEISDLHFGEDEDTGEEWVEVEYTTDDGTVGVRQLSVDASVERRVPLTV
ncbi:FtsK/SpoIIIE domain-containing protein [Streptomyces sp. NPDC037389]|uniref:FtsK/SpoIIIE domain-containing protein n=1 Tax=Streptomyces sp. NPDC037389 TaxID=3155369 RepID=UPI0033F228E8